ncbi:MAG: site-specific integrase [Planctomycetaceae bacterium]|nr:site-specific integrase [Planctomycetaceae bacterium]
MSDEIKVHVVDYGRKCLYMRYRDPATGKHIARSTGVETRAKDAKRLASKVAGKWEDQLQEGRYKSPSKTTWEDFRERYEDQAVPAMATDTQYPIRATFKSIEKLIAPKLLRDVTAAQVTLWQHRMREKDFSESTIRSYSTHLRAALNWAVVQGMLTTAPKVSMPKRARKSDGRTPMKGRPITTEEFERMLAKTVGVVGENRAAAWKHLLRGLWWSGLRIGEACKLTWDHGGGLSVDLSGDHPMLRIDADHEKGNRDRFLPIAPEFAEMLMMTPEADRVGFVFNPPGRYDAYGRASQDVIERMISKIGRLAVVKVLESSNMSKARTKYASAHDFRRAFGTRWAVRVMPIDLQQLMRHESIETTLRFYVGLDAQSTMSRLYAAVSSGNTLGNTTPQTSKGAASRSTQPLS